MERNNRNSMERKRLIQVFEQKNVWALLLKHTFYYWDKLISVVIVVVAQSLIIIESTVKWLGFKLK